MSNNTGVGPQTIIQLVHDGLLTDEEKADLRYLIADALDVFSRSRKNAEVYVDKHYAGLEGGERVDKVEQVRRRARLADKLRGAALRVYFDTE